MRFKSAGNSGQTRSATVMGRRDERYVRRGFNFLFIYFFIFRTTQNGTIAPNSITPVGNRHGDYNYN